MDEDAKNEEARRFQQVPPAPGRACARCDGVAYGPHTAYLPRFVEGFVVPPPTRKVH